MAKRTLVPSGSESACASRSMATSAPGAATSFPWLGPSITTGTSPFLSALPRKMSAMEVETTARMPKSRRAQGGGGGGRARQHGPPAGPLPALEVAVGRGDAVLPALEVVPVHGDAHRATGLAPLGAGVLEDPVEPLGLGGPLHRGRAGDDQGA